MQSPLRWLKSLRQRLARYSLQPWNLFPHLCFFAQIPEANRLCNDSESSAIGLGVIPEQNDGDSFCFCAYMLIDFVDLEAFFLCKRLAL
jgi:hypothetical protein